MTAPDDGATEGYLDEPMQVPGSAAAGSIVFTMDENPPEKLIEPDESIVFPEKEIPIPTRGAVPSGKKKRTKQLARSGRYIRSRPLFEGEPASDIAVDATLRAMALRSSREEGGGTSFHVTRGDLRKKIRNRVCNRLVVFVLDSSDSMGIEERMASAKGAVLSLLTHSYQKRDRVSLVSFRDEHAVVLLEPTNSVSLARERLKRLPTGGATPFADGLLKAWQLIRNERIRDPAIEPLLIVISDGEANIPLEPGRGVLGELLDIAGRIRRKGIPSLSIDTRRGGRGDGNMRRIATSLGGLYRHAFHPTAGSVLDMVNEAEDAMSGVEK